MEECRVDSHPGLNYSCPEILPLLGILTMIRRNLADHLLALASRHPTITLTGPRQSGKTTLVRSTFPDRPLVSLEDPDVRARAQADPRGFLRQFNAGAIFDEVQRAPELLSYLQGIIDTDPAPGRFILTGSQHFGLMAGVSQSLAGRTSIQVLLPFSQDEIARFKRPASALDTVLWTGGYPAIHDRSLPPGEWLASYTATYLERDVRQLSDIRDLRTFQSFVALCAGRTGQLLNIASLAADAGVAHGTAKAWLSFLEASWLVHLLPAWHTNVTSRLVKMPKLHFVDSGLACWLLGIRSPDQLALHPLRGAIFESWVVSEILKRRVHEGLPPDLFHVRDRKGREVDLVIRDGASFTAVEVKAGRTVVPEMGKILSVAEDLLDAPVQRRLLVYGGDEAQNWSNMDVVPWTMVSQPG